jgi:hypothetical protein
MSVARVHSFAFAGIDSMPVQVSSGLPAFLMVGLLILSMLLID